MPLLIGLLSFISVSLLTYEVLRPRSNTVARRAAGSSRDAALIAAERTHGGPIERLMMPPIRRWGHRLAMLLPHNFVRGIDRMLVMAAQPWSLPGFLFAWALSIALSLALLYYVIQSSAATVGQAVLWAALILPVAMLLPYAYLRSRVKRRQKLIVRALPDAMDLLVTSVEAGLGIDAAFALVAEKTGGPLSDTIATYLRAVGFGRSRREALQEAADSTGVEALTGIASAVNQSEQLGSTLGDVLRVKADDLRVARRQRAEAAAQRAPVLMTIPLVTCFLPAMGAVVLVPAVLNMARFVGAIGGP